MAKKLNENIIQNELSQGSAFFNKNHPTSVIDIDDRRPDITTQQDERNDVEKLEIIIEELSKISVSTYGSPVRLSEAEKQDIEDFIYIHLRKKGLQGKVVSSAKLMRYALRYMIKVQPEKFVDALSKALIKEDKLSI